MNAIVVESILEDAVGTSIGARRLVTWLPWMFMEFLRGVILDAIGLTASFRIILA